MIRDMAEAQGLRLVHRLGPGVEGLYLGDARRIRQVLLNLLSNAVKFTTTGHVALHVARRAEGGLRFSVSDTGPGIPEASAISCSSPSPGSRGRVRRTGRARGWGWRSRASSWS